jgi:hypothetical protein
MAIEEKQDAIALDAIGFFRYTVTLGLKRKGET